MALASKGQPKKRSRESGRQTKPLDGFSADHRVWAAIDHEDRIFAMRSHDNENAANVWFSRLQTGRTCVPLVLRPGQEPRIGDRVYIDDEWSGHLAPVRRSRPNGDVDWQVCARIAGLHAVLDAAAMSDGERRHELLTQALRELRELHQRHADRLTVAMLEAA